MKDIKPTVTAASLRRSESAEDPEKLSANSHEDEKARAKDEAAAQAALAALIGDEGDSEPITEEDKKKVLRKIDCCLLPLMCLAVLLQFLDKTSLNYANLLGIQEDLGLHGMQYSWLGSIFYIGYLASSPIHGYFLQRYDISRYVSVCILLWGGVLALHAACYNYAGLVTCRLFLGIFEGGLTPAFILMVSNFYTRKEQVSRTGIWFAQNGTAQILGGGIAYGVQVQKPGPLAVWRQLYVILGSITIAFGFLTWFCMPTSPERSRMLTPRQRRIALERVRENKTGLMHKKWKWDQAKEAALDPRLYLFALVVCAANIANGGVSNFGSQIIKNFGYSKTKTSLLGMAPGGVEIVAVALGVVLANYTGSRVLAGIASYGVAILGAALMIGLPVANKSGRFAGYCVLYFYPVASPLLYSLLSSSVGGTTKKIVFNVALQLGYAAGNIIGPQTYTAASAPGYAPAKATILAMFCVASLALAGIFLVHLRWNRQRDASGASAEGEPTLIELSDKTEKEVLSYRYPY